MPTYVLAPKELANAYRHGDAERRKKILNALYQSALEGEAVVAQDTPVDTSRTRNAWHTVRQPYGADLVNDSPIAAILETGSRPHWPPFEPILRWVVRTFGTADGRRGFESRASVDPELFAIARGVQKSIAVNGTPAHWMLKKNLPRLRRILARNIQQALS